MSMSRQDQIDNVVGWRWLVGATKLLLTGLFEVKLPIACVGLLYIHELARFRLKAEPIPRTCYRSVADGIWSVSQSYNSRSFGGKVEIYTYSVSEAAL